MILGKGLFLGKEWMILGKGLFLGKEWLLVLLRGSTCHLL